MPGRPDFSEKTPMIVRISGPGPAKILNRSKLLPERADKTASSPLGASIAAFSIAAFSIAAFPIVASSLAVFPIVVFYTS